MKELIPKDDYGIFVDNKDTMRVDSLFVAKMFGKRHDHVLRDIAKIIDPKSGLSKEFIRLNFQEAKYKDSTGRKLPCYYMTRNGFTIIVMGYTGEKAMQFKEAYMKRFDEMEEFINNLAETRQEFPLLTEQIKLLHENPKPYHFSNECDMINRLVLGMTAKKFRELHDIPKGESIRPYLSNEQIQLIDKLQKIDIGLMVAIPEYEQRKQYLEAYLSKTKFIN